MRRPAFLVSVFGITFGSLAGLWACGEQLPDPLTSDGGGSGDAGSDTSRLDASQADTLAPHPDDPACTAIDLTPGDSGTKFCELPGTDTPDITVPDGFCIREFTTTPIKEARVLRFAPNGDLFVVAPSYGTPGGSINGLGGMVVLPDDNHDGVADSNITFAGPYPGGPHTCADLEADPENLACMHGILFDGGYLYYSRSDEVRRIPYKSGDRVLGVGVASELVAPLLGGGGPEMRWTHTLEKTKSGSIYVSRGRFDASGCVTSDMEKGAVLELHIEDPSKTFPLTPEVVGNGFRNPMYIRCAPNSCGDCYANELTGDGWDGTGAAEKVALLGNPKGQSWGFPCCVGPSIYAPGSDKTAYDCTTVGPERVRIPLHDTPFGMDFERGLFPAPYTHGIFTAIHGVVTSFGGTGIIFEAVDPTSLRPTGAASVFAKGFRPTGRATDVAFAPDGRMFIADDTSGRIFWVAPRDLQMPSL